MPGLMVFLFDLAKDANAFTELESDCSGMQRTGTERHQGSFCFYLFSGVLNKEVLPYLSLFSRQIDLFPPPLDVNYFCKKFPREVRQLVWWGMVFFPKWYYPMLFLKPYSLIYSSCGFLPAVFCWPHRFWSCWDEMWIARCLHFDCSWWLQWCELSPNCSRWEEWFLYPTFYAELCCHNGCK